MGHGKRGATKGNRPTETTDRSSDEPDRSTGDGTVTSDVNGEATASPVVDQHVDQLIGDASDATAGDDPIPPDDRFDVLKNERRRRVLDYLRRQESLVTTSEIAEHVASIENDKSPELLTAQERKRVYIGLYQCHLPRMDDMDVVDFDKDRGVLELGPQAPPLYKYLEEPDDPGFERAARYLGVSAVGIVSLLVAVGVASAASTLTVALHGGIVAVLGSMALVDAYAGPD